MWREAGPERETRTGKCMSGLVWLGEEEKGGSGAGSRADVPARDGSAAGGFVHVFARAWAVPEAFLRRVAGVGDRARSLPRAGDRPGFRCGVGGLAPGSQGSSGRRPEWARPLTELSFSVGDMVCMSSEGGLDGDHRRVGRGREGEFVGRARGGHEMDHVRLLTGNIVAVHEDTVEVLSEKMMRVPRRGGRGPRGGNAATGSEAGEPLDIEDLLDSGCAAGRDGDGGVTGGGPGETVGGTVFFRIDKDEWAAGIK